MGALRVKRRGGLSLTHALLLKPPPWRRAAWWLPRPFAAAAPRRTPIIRWFESHAPCVHHVCQPSRRTFMAASCSVATPASRRSRALLRSAASRSAAACSACCASTAETAAAAAARSRCSSAPEVCRLAATLVWVYDTRSAGSVLNALSRPLPAPLLWQRLLLSLPAVTVIARRDTSVQAAAY